MGQEAIWDDLVGASWVAYTDVIDEHSAPFGRAAADALGLLTGSRVLDVGCGTGTTTLDLVSRGAAEAVGVDLSTRMVAHARSRAQGLGIAAATFEVGDVLARADDRPFDAVFSRFGVMFFDDAVEAFARLHAMVADGGRLAFSAWTDPFTNPWMLVPVMAAAGILGPPELPAPGEPGPFSLGTPERILEVLGPAGWRDVEIALLEVEQAHPAGDAAEVATMALTNNPVIAIALKPVPEKADEVHAAITEALRPHEHDGTVVLGAAALIVSADA